MNEVLEGRCPVVHLCHLSWHQAYCEAQSCAQDVGVGWGDRLEKS